jgi:hypothetical protein
MTEVTNVVVRAKKTNAEKLVIALAAVDTLRALIAKDAILNNVFAGNEVEFTFGRAEKARVLRGIVSAVKEPTEESPRKLALVRINVGTFEEQSLKVAVTDITRNFTAEAADEAEGDQVEGSQPYNPIDED